MTCLEIRPLFWGDALSSPSSLVAVKNYSATVDRFADRPTTAEFVGGENQRQMCLLEALSDAVGSAGHDNWDGEGSRAVREDSIARAPAFLRLIPRAMQSPEISVSPHGSTIFDWDFGPSRQLSIALSARGAISFACYYEGARSHGEFPFYPERLPDEVVLAFNRWLRQPSGR